MSKRSQMSQKKNTRSQTSRNPVPGLSQSTLTDSFLNQSTSDNGDDANVDENVNKVVRYIIYKAGSNLPIRKADIQKNVIPGIGKKYEKVMVQAIKNLKEIYGYDLHLCDQPVSNKQYTVKNILPYVDFDSGNVEVPENGRQVLILLVLTHIFMSNNSAPEASLFRFLQSLKIDPYENHNIFGNVKEFVTNDMVKQRYLTVTANKDANKNIFSWGPKAEFDVSKNKILEFVCKIYGNCQPTGWTQQFKMAQNQENDDLETSSESMVVSSDSE